MNTYLSKITAKGQITLPKPIREKLRFETGAYLEMQVRGQELVIKTITPKSEGLLLKDYAASISGNKVDDLQQLRKRFAKLPVSPSAEVRAGRDED